MEGEDSAFERGAEIYGSLKSSVITGGGTRIGHYDSAGEEMRRAVLRSCKTACMGLNEIDQMRPVEIAFSGPPARNEGNTS